MIKIILTFMLNIVKSPIFFLLHLSKSDGINCDLVRFVFVVGSDWLAYQMNDSLEEEI